MNNQECKVRLQIANVNSEEPVFFIKNLYAKLCVPDVVKKLSVRVFNLMSRTNETRHIE